MKPSPPPRWIGNASSRSPTLRSSDHRQAECPGLQQQLLDLAGVVQERVVRGDLQRDVAGRSGMTGHGRRSVGVRVPAGRRRDLGRPLHEHESATLGMAHKLFGGDVGHHVVGVMHPLAALEAQREGEGFL